MRPAALLAMTALLGGVGGAQTRQEHLAAAGLEQEFRRLAQGQTAWLGYAVPAAASEGWNCQSSAGVRPPGPVRLEPAEQVFVLFRLDQGKVVKIRTLPGDCLLDTGGLTLHWLTNVRPAESVALLETFVDPDRRLTDAALAAIAQHADPAAARELIRMTQDDKDTRLRKKAVFWLARSPDPQAWAFIEKILK